MSGDHKSEIIRIEHAGRVYRWQRSGRAWPGHTTYLAIRVNEIILGDTYADEGIEQTYSCHPGDFLDGCFHDLVRADFGDDALGEIIAEIRATVHVPERDRVARRVKDEARAATTRAVAEEKSADDKASAIAGSAPAGSERPGEHRPAGKPVAGATVSVALTGCKRVDLPLIAALRAITRGPVKKLLDQVGRSPCILASDLPVAEGEVIKQRLGELGATVELRG